MSRLSKVSKQLRKNILRASFEAQAGHIPSAFSILEIVHMLYKNILQDNDVFVLSKGHGCLALYAVFMEMGFITEEQFYSFSQYDSLLGGHPHRGKHNKIYASTDAGILSVLLLLFVLLLVFLLFLFVFFVLMFVVLVVFSVALLFGNLIE